jgi:tetratricopeptide (TPR) repeat protein
VRSDKPKSNGGITLRQEVESLIAKGRFKDAVKQAKLCYRADQTPDHHHLLERAYCLRARQLLQAAMPAAAREVAQHLLDFAITDPTLFDDAAQLLLSVGMTREAKALCGKIEAPGLLEQFTHQEADLAVVHPERCSQAPAEIRDGAQAIRLALTAVQQADDEKVLVALRDISRSSPFADWKLFVRGLAAHARGDLQECKSNWDRLNPERAAARIARAVQTLDVTSSQTDGAVVSTKLKLDAIERHLFGDPVLEPLAQLKQLVATDQWQDAIRRIPLLRRALGTIDPALPVRLTNVIYEAVIKEARELDYKDAMTLIRNFTHVSQPPTFDPRWNRLFAIVWDGDQGELEQAEEYWLKYLADLDQITSLKIDQRNLARALVLKRLGEKRAERIEHILKIRPMLGAMAVSDQVLEQERVQTVSFLERSLELAPHHRPTYLVLLDAFKEWDQLDKAAAIARRMVDKFPNDFDTLIFLANFHFNRQEADPALDCARRARALKPLDQQATETEWAIHMLQARTLALKSQWDEGRAAFMMAEQLKPETRDLLHVRARRAVFELKAGQTEIAESMIETTAQSLPEPTPLWLALSIESIRYELPSLLRKRFESQWLTAIPRKVRGETAAALAKLMGPFLSGKNDYRGHKQHLKQVNAYISRTTKIKYTRDDLTNVCGFLSLQPTQETLAFKFVQRGIKLFPKEPLFLLLAGKLEFAKYQRRKGSAFTAQSYLQKGIALAETSDTPENAKLLGELRKSLSMIQDIVGSPRNRPFGNRGFGPNAGAEEFEGFFDFFNQMMDDEDFDDDDDDDDDNPVDSQAPSRPLPLPGAGRKPPAKHKKKAKSS